MSVEKEKMTDAEKLAKLLGLKSKYRVIVENYIAGGKKQRMFITAPSFDSKEEAQEHIDSIASKYEKASIEEISVTLKKPDNFMKFLEVLRVCDVPFGLLNKDWVHFNFNKERISPEGSFFEAFIDLAYKNLVGYRDLEEIADIIECAGRTVWSF